MWHVGMVTVSRVMDYEDDETFPDPKQISSVLTVYEDGMTNKSVTVNLFVIIRDINDNRPQFTEHVRNSFNFLFSFSTSPKIK